MDFPVDIEKTSKRRRRSGAPREISVIKPATPGVDGRRVSRPGEGGDPDGPVVDARNRNESGDIAIRQVAARQPGWLWRRGAPCPAPSVSFLNSTRPVQSVKHSSPRLAHPWDQSAWAAVPGRQARRK